MKSETIAIIPDFDENHVLPPFRQSPKVEQDMSPYRATTLELCERFGKHKVRRNILRGFLEFRSVLTELNMVNGFQWLDGYFMEDFEHARGKTPDYVQVVTFYHQPPKPFPPPDLTDTFQILTNPQLLEDKYFVNHQVVRLDAAPEVIVKKTRFWWGQMSHTEEAKTWKGLVQVPLNTPEDDATALQYLKTLEKK